MFFDRDPPDTPAGAVPELGDELVIDAETAAKLDRTRAEMGEDLSLEDVRRLIGMRPA